MRKCLPKTFLSAYSITLSFVFVNQKAGKSFRKNQTQRVLSVFFLHRCQSRVETPSAMISAIE